MLPATELIDTVAPVTITVTPSTVVVLEMSAPFTATAFPITLTVTEPSRAANPTLPLSLSLCAPGQWNSSTRRSRSSASGNTYRLKCRLGQTALEFAGEQAHRAPIPWKSHLWPLKLPMCGSPVDRHVMSGWLHP